MSEATRRKLAAMLADGKAPKKDQPGLIDDAARLAEAGRRGDRMVAHITPEEAALLHARGGAGTINPRTGLLEFYDSSFDGGGAGNQDAGFGGGGFASDTTGGASPGAGAMPGEDRAQAPNIGDFAPSYNQDGFDPWAGTLGGKVGDKAMPSFNENRGFLDRIGDNVRASFQDMATRPGEAVANALLGLAVPGYGVVNSLVGLAAPGNTLAGFAMDATKGGIQSEYMGADNATSPGGDKDSPLGGDRGGDSGGPASGAGGPLSQSQSALAQALAGNTPLNDGRKTFGALVESFDPNGRRYVTPWAYRG